MRPEKEEEAVEEKSRLIEFPSREKAKVVLVRATHTKLRPTIYSTNFHVRGGVSRESSVW